MFTVIEGEPVEHKHNRWWPPAAWSLPVEKWIVWCGWQDAFSASWNTLEEACRDAALKEWFWQRATASSARP